MSTLTSLTNPKAWRATFAAVGERRLRLVSGLILFAFVTTHLANHSLGNISIDAMEEGVQYFEWIWRNPVGLAALYLGLITHGALGFVALYQRRTFRYKAMEVPQLILGLLIPLVLLMHIVAVRFAMTLHGTHKTYAQELLSFWVTSPGLGVLQVLLLIVAWAHGCIGIYFWLRLKKGFTTPLRMVMLAFAVALPLLALLGFYQGGRVIMNQAQSAQWRDAHATSIEVGTRDEQEQLLDIRAGLLIGYVGIFAAVMAARFWRRRRELSGGTVNLTYPDRTTLRVPKGLSILEASTRYQRPHAAVCGGKGRCGTCRVSVVAGRENLPPPSPVEAEMLRRIGAESGNIRLACQVRPTGDVSFVPMLPPNAGLGYVVGGRRLRSGQRRDVVCVFIEMRDVAAHESGKAKATDLVFTANRFLDAAVRAVRESGGQPNRIYGHGLMALFGLDKDLPAASRQALEAVAMTKVSVDHLNETFKADVPEPIRFVVGMHSGSVTLGEVGYQDDVVFSAVGGVVRDAAHLLDLARLVPCDALISETVCAAAGLPAHVLTRRELTLPGSDRAIAVRAAADAAALFGALDALVDVSANFEEPPKGARLAPA